MRVISGKAGRLKLVTPEGLDVRPTTDRIKETLFNILNPYIYGCKFLDVCAGSGQIGIEALSRGAESAVFVEVSPKSLDCIKKNLKTTRLEENALVINTSAENCVNKLYTLGKKFDIIFIDPPYDHLIEKDFIIELSKYDILENEGIVIVEASIDTDLSYVSEFGFSIDREKSYGSNKHIFLSKDN